MNDGRLAKMAKNGKPSGPELDDLQNVTAKVGRRLCETAARKYKTRGSSAARSKSLVYLSRAIFFGERVSSLKAERAFQVERSIAALGKLILRLCDR